MNVPEENFDKNNTYTRSIIFSLIFIAPAIVFNKHGTFFSLLFFSILVASVHLSYFKRLVTNNKWLYSYTFIIYGLYYSTILLNDFGHVDSGFTTFLMIVICISQLFIKNR